MEGNVNALVSRALRIGAACSIALIAATLVHAPLGAADLVTLRVAVSPSDDDTAPLLYAKGTGMFERAGLDVQIQRLGSGSAIASAVSGGAIDIGKSSIISLLGAHQHGIPFSIVGTCALYNVNAPFDGLVVAKDSPIATGADFNGKTVSTQSLNDVGQVAESAWVDQHGGNSKTLHFVEIPTSAAAPAVESHRVDAAILLEPVLSSSMADGKLRLLGHAFGSIAPAFLFAAWFTTNDYAAQHVDAIRKFITVIYQAGAFTNTHHKDAAAIVAQQIKLPLDVVQNAQWSVAGTSLDADQIQPVIDTAAKYGTISKTFSYRDLVNPAFLNLKTR
jgi:NitT/TauT family transport system substrate-binding protein